MKKIISLISLLCLSAPIMGEENILVQMNMEELQQKIQEKESEIASLKDSIEALPSLFSPSQAQRNRVFLQDDLRAQQAELKKLEEELSSPAPVPTP